MIGVIGGMGPAATVDFMAKVIEETPAQGDEDHVPLLVHCDPRIPSRPPAILVGGPSPLPRLLEIRDRLLQAGATALVMPCHTAHHWYQALREGCPVPFISIVEVSCAEAAATATPDAAIGLLGTQATLDVGMYQASLQAAGLRWELPDAAAMREQVLPAILAVKQGQEERAGALLEGCLDTMQRNTGVSRFVLACTELPLAAAHMSAAARARCIDPTRALARASVAHWRASIR